MIEIALKIQDVDDAAATNTMVPVLMERLSGSSNPIVSLLFGKGNSLPATAAKAALEALPKNVKEELAAACLNRYSAEVSRAIESLAARKGIRLTVESVKATAAV